VDLQLKIIPRNDLADEGTMHQLLMADVVALWDELMPDPARFEGVEASGTQEARTSAAESSFVRAGGATVARAALR